jgi:arylsulfatase A-like enzyme
MRPKLKFSRILRTGVRVSWRPKGATRWVLSCSPWLSASVIALALLCAADCAWPPSRPPAAFVGYLLLLAIALGLVHGSLWSLGFWLVRRLMPRAAFLFWPAISLSMGAWLARELGAFTRLHSRYSKLAIAVLAACSAGGLALGLLWTAFQPSIRRPHGSLLEWHPWLRRALALLLIGATVALMIADRRLYPDQYRAAHGALRIASLWATMMALVAWFGRMPIVTRPRWLLAAVGFGICLFALTEQQARALEAFDARRWPSAVLALSRTLVDFDRDGYASLLGGADCAPWNRRIHPGAREIPGNGIDENCVLGDSRPNTGTFQWPALAKGEAPSDVVLITIDALNPTHLGVYDPARYGVGGRGTSPNLDRFAAQSTVFDRAYSPGGWTSIAVPSLLRGVYPRKLRWRRYYETTQFALLRKPLEPKLRPGEIAMHLFPFAFDDPHPTLPELLWRRGMLTIAVIDDGYSAMLQRGTGIERGFEVFKEVDSLSDDLRNDAGTAKLALAEIARLPANRRFFMWIHFFGTHWPDERHPGTREYGTTPADSYDHEVAFLDEQLQRVLEALQARPHPPAVLIAADHGEGLSTVTRSHGLTLDESVIRIPLIAHVPGWPLGHQQGLAGSVDLAPTILALTNTPAPTDLDGVDLATRLGNAPARVMFSDTWRITPREHIEIDFAAAYDGTRKFILDHAWNRLYAVGQGPGSERLPPRLVGSAPLDALSGSVFAYLEETGPLRLQD